MDDYSIRGQKSYLSDANLTRLDTEWSHKLRSLIVTSTQEYWNNSGNLFQAFQTFNEDCLLGYGDA